MSGYCALQDTEAVRQYVVLTAPLQDVSVRYCLPQFVTPHPDQGAVSALRRLCG